MLEYQKKMAALEREKALRDVEAAGKVMKNKLGGHKRNLVLKVESEHCALPHLYAISAVFPSKFDRACCQTSGRGGGKETKRDRGESATLRGGEAEGRRVLSPQATGTRTRRKTQVCRAPRGESISSSKLQIVPVNYPSGK